MTGIDGSVERSTDDEVGAFLRGVADLRLAERRLQSLVSERLGLTVSDLLALGMLSRGDRTVGRLAVELELTPGSASLLVKRLVEAGLVVRVPNETDRRTADIRLTDQGDETFRAVRDRYAEAVHAAATTLPDASLATASALLAESARRLADQVADPFE